jgi:hypothetical protein
MLEFNEEKCVVMHLCHDIPTEYRLNGARLNPTEQERDLGVIVTKNFKSSKQTVTAAQKANKVLGLIRRHFKQIDSRCFLVLYKAYVRPHLEFAVQAWAPHLQKDIRCLEKVQRRATKMVTGLRNKSYEQRLQKLRLTTLQQRRLRGDLIETYKIMTGKEDIDRNQFFQLAPTEHDNRGHSLKLYCQRACTDSRKYNFSIISGIN